MKKAWILFCNGIIWDVVFSGELVRELIKEIYGVKLDPHLNIEHFAPNTSISIDINRNIITIKCMTITGDGK